MYFRLDQLGKNILRDVFVLVGSAETEVEVPPGDAQRIDVWHVPDPEQLRAHPEIEPGLLRSMASEPGMVEVFSAALDPAEFHGCMRKRYQWHHTLELRAERQLPVPATWLLSAGRPDGVLREFGFVQDAAGPEGLYGLPAPGWRVRIVVIAELPRARSTVLLRLLGSARVRRAALRDLAELPEDAWERRVALPWLVRLSFEVPEDLLPALPAEERDLIVETREWFEQFTARRIKEGIQEAIKEAEERGELQMTVRLCAMRLGRPLTEAEHAALAERLDRVGQDRVGEVVLSFTPEALATWLSAPDAS
ncbi:hypothetical protein SOCE26_049660 [Sorangium cellulosum]|uniref:DUF4351 domain-containing protein n=1 Tax=Sorangium cellulosum TaxID=56 RepID=A0A2L0EW33_SORCE|nr:hypothetical protein [Sorangium cellulosum]AUX43517.1 hypothetical protein SOCE26_049660 [Sorangium cellulosum]